MRVFINFIGPRGPSYSANSCHKRTEHNTSSILSVVGPKCLFYVLRRKWLLLIKCLPFMRFIMHS